MLESFVMFVLFSPNIILDFAHFCFYADALPSDVSKANIFLKQRNVRGLMRTEPCMHLTLWFYKCTKILTSSNFPKRQFKIVPVWHLLVRMSSNRLFSGSPQTYKHWWPGWRILGGGGRRWWPGRTTKTWRCLLWPFLVSQVAGLRGNEGKCWRTLQNFGVIHTESTW